jgi:tetratricopeptide (TPR) repeat protein
MSKNKANKGNVYKAPLSKNNPPKSLQHKKSDSLPFFQNYFTSLWKVGIFFFILILAVYGNSISNKYSFDDDFVTLNNPQIKKGIKGIPEILTSHYASTKKQNYDYRPIVKISYAIEYAMFKESPHISHFVNLLLYFLLSLLMFALLRKLLRDYHPIIPLLTVILFIVHPIHTEVVDSLKNRDEILCMIGGLLAIYSFVKLAETNHWKWIIAGILSLTFSYYSKSSTIVFIAAIPLTLYFFTELKTKKLIFITVGILFLIVLLRILPQTFLDKADREILFFENPLYFQKGLGLRLGTAFIALLFYMKMLVFPHPLLFYYGYDQIPVANLMNIWAIISLIITGFLIFVALKLFKRKHILSFSILFFFITISLYLNLIKPPPGIVAERFLFTASLGFCLALVVLIFMIFKIDIRKKEQSLKQLRNPLWLLILLIIPMSIRTISRNQDWENFETLYTHDIKYLDRSAKANSVYAAMLYEKTFKSKDKKIAKNSAIEARKYYKKALEIYPEYSTCWNNLGVLEFKFFGNISKAMHCWRQAIKLDTAYTEAMFNLASAYEQNKQLDSAEYLYFKTISLKKDFGASYSKLGGIYFGQGKLQKALDINKRLMEVDPTSDEPYINIGNYYLLLKDTTQAIANWEKAIEKQPANQALNNNLARYFQHIKDFKKADYYTNLANQNPRKKN